MKTPTVGQLVYTKRLGTKRDYVVTAVTKSSKTFYMKPVYSANEPEPDKVILGQVGNPDKSVDWKLSGTGRDVVRVYFKD